MTTDADHALDLLAEAETGPELELAELVRAAHPVTASGGLVVAILADRDEESLRQVASLRQPGGSGLAIVLDTATFADSPGGAHTATGRGDPAKGTGRPVGERLRRAAPHRGLVGRGGPQGDGVPRGVVRADHPRGAGRMISRVVDALLAAAATIAAILGLTTLTENTTWLGRAIWACLVVAAVGRAAARRPPFRLLVLFGQLVAHGAWAVVAMFAADRLWYGLPGPAAWKRVAELANECAAVMQRYAAPIPATEGVAVRPRRRGRRAGGPRRLPRGHRGDAGGGGAAAARGLPHRRGQRRLVALAVVLRHRRRRCGWSSSPARVAGRVQRWSTTVASLRTPVAETDVESQVMWGFGNVARQLGFAAVVAAVVLPAVIPHLPTRYILDGLGRNDGSIGREGRVGFNSTVDLDPQPPERRRQHRPDLPHVGADGSAAAGRRRLELRRRHSGRRARLPRRRSSSPRAASSPHRCRSPTARWRSSRTT